MFSDVAIGGSYGSNSYSGGPRFQGGETGGSILDRAMPFLGPVLGNGRSVKNDGRAFTHYDLPEAYKGNNEFLNDRLQERILEDESFWTTIVLPYRRTNNTQFEMNTWKFNHVIAGEVPHEGVSRLVTSSKASQKATIQRRGLAFQMEADFFETDAGRQSYYQNIEGINACILETTHYDILYEVLASRDNKTTLEQSYRYATDSNRARFDDQVVKYGCLMEGADVFENVVSKAKHAMHSGRKVEPNVMICPPGILLYAQGARMGTTYWIPDPYDNSKHTEVYGPTSSASMLNIPVFETTDFDVNADGRPPVELLVRNSAISEYYHMGEGSSYELTDPESYASSDSSIYIFDENEDKFMKISKKDAFIYSRIFNDKSGSYSDELKQWNRLFNDLGLKLPGGSADEFEQDERTRKGDKPNNRFHFLMTESTADTKGGSMLAKYFGQFHPTSASKEDFSKVARSAKSTCIPFEETEAKRIYSDGMRLLSNIEKQTPSEYWFHSVYEANILENCDSDGNFIGQRTASDLIPIIGDENVVEQWKSSPSGTLVLPQKGFNKEIDIYPAGYSSLQGLRALAREADKHSSHWNTIGKVAKQFINLLEEIKDSLMKTMPSSEYLNALNRSPWFQDADPLTTLFENGIYMSRQPIWLAFIPPATDDITNKVRGAKNLGRASAEHPPNKNSWYYVPSLGMNEMDNAEVMNEILEPQTSDTLRGMIKSKQKLYVFPSIITGSTVEIPEFLLMRGLVNTQDLRILNLIGQVSKANLANILTAASTSQDVSLTPEALQARKRLLISTVYAMTAPVKNSGIALDKNVITTKKRIRNFINGLADEIKSINDGTDLTTFIDKLYDARPSSGNPEKTEITNIMKKGSLIEDDEDLTGKIGSFNLQNLANIDTKAMEKHQRNLIKHVNSITNAIGAFNDIIKKYMPNKRLVRFRIKPLSDEESEENDLYANIAKLIKSLPTKPSEVGVQAANLFEALKEDMAALTNEYNAFNNEYKIKDMIDEEIAEYENIAQKDDDLDDSMVRASTYAHLNGIGARFYRTNLMMTDSILDYCVKTMAKCMIRPSDPDFNHTQPFVMQAPSGDNIPNFPILPQSLTKKIRLASINTQVPKKMEELSFLSSSMNDEETVHQSKRKYNPIALNVSSNKKQKITTSQRMASSLDDVYGIDRDEMYDPRYDESEETKRDRELYKRPTGNSKRLVEIRNNYFSERFTKANQIIDPIERLFTLVFLFTRCDNKNHWLTLYDKNVYLPISFLIFRPYIEHMMASFVLLKGGIELGATLIGPSNFATTFDNGIKMIYGNITYNNKAWVWRPNNVEIINNVKPTHYEGGHNTKWIKTIEDLRQQDQERPSLISCAIPCTEKKFHQIVNFGGFSQEGYNAKDINNEPIISYSTALYYKDVWRIGISNSDNLDVNYFTEETCEDINARQGLFYSYDNSQRRFSKENGSKGHLKRGMIYEGCAAAWNGNSKFVQSNRIPDMKPQLE